MSLMSIDEKQTCNMHTNEKEKSGTCCQIRDEQERAEALTYEQSFVNKALKRENKQLIFFLYRFYLFCKKKFINQSNY